jgi:hypothetical protein
MVSDGGWVVDGHVDDDGAVDVDEDVSDLVDESVHRGGEECMDDRTRSGERKRTRVNRSATMCDGRGRGASEKRPKG